MNKQDMCSWDTKAEPIVTTLRLTESVAYFKISPVSFIEDRLVAGTVFLIIEDMKWWMCLRLYRTYKFKKYLFKNKPMGISFKVMISV